MGSACVSETCKSLGGPAVYVLIGCLIPLSSSGSVLLRLTMYPILLYRLAFLHPTDKPPPCPLSDADC